MQQKHNKISYPFIKTPPLKEYTLILDLDETLIHYDPNEDVRKYNKRPYAQEFIERLSAFFEIVIFTAAKQDYADWIIDDLDPNDVISHRFYREHTFLKEGTNIKDLKKVGRDSSKVIIVDNVGENFQNQPENGILIKSWYRDESDQCLKILMNVLLLIGKKKNRDLRVELSEL